jgi:para-aminobenzoate synthetase component 1
LIDLHGVKNFTPTPLPPLDVRVEKFPVSFDVYRRSFDVVKEHLRRGNSYLCNLTFPTRLETNLTLDDFFYRSTAKFRLLVRERFAVFSPERFVTIKDNVISTYPMKGTIDAAIPSEKKMLADEKELADHVHSGRSLRNDLRRCVSVAVESFRDIVTFETVQRYSPDDLEDRRADAGRLARPLGSILDELLPAGLSPASEAKTVGIIREPRRTTGDYTWRLRRFDGESLDSAVAIRFVEQTPGGWSTQRRRY